MLRFWTRMFLLCIRRVHWLVTYGDHQPSTLSYLHLSQGLGCQIFIFMMCLVASGQSKPSSANYTFWRPEDDQTLKFSRIFLITVFLKLPYFLAILGVSESMWASVVRSFLMDNRILSSDTSVVDMFDCPSVRSPDTPFPDTILLAAYAYIKSFG